MELTLNRTRCDSTGVYGEMLDDTGQLLWYTLEHAYQQLSGNWSAKVPAGVYQCVRGTHALSNGVPFETFEVTGVPGHTGILIHPGNTDADSEGCILLGMGTYGNTVTNSRIAFSAFMSLQLGVNQFTLTVNNPPENSECLAA